MIKKEGRINFDHNVFSRPTAINIKNFLIVFKYTPGCCKMVIARKSDIMSNFFSTIAILDTSLKCISPTVIHHFVEKSESPWYMGVLN